MKTNSIKQNEPGAASLNDSTAPKCFVCDEPIADRCFCRIHRKNAEPVTLCCPSCAIRFIDSTHSTDYRSEQLLAHEKSVHLLIAEEKMIL